MTLPSKADGPVRLFIDVDSIGWQLIVSGAGEYLFFFPRLRIHPYGRMIGTDDAKSLKTCSSSFSTGISLPLYDRKLGQNRLMSPLMPAFVQQLDCLVLSLSFFLSLIRYLKRFPFIKRRRGWWASITTARTVPFFFVSFPPSSLSFCCPDLYTVY